MGRFKADAILVRELPELTIIFYDRQSIYIYPKNQKFGSIFNLWFSHRGAYTEGWQDFRRRLMRKKHLTPTQCYELAIKYGVVGIGTDRRIDLTGKKVRIVYE